MDLIRNEWYSIIDSAGRETFARWRDATADQRYDVFCFEVSLNGEIILYEEHLDEGSAIARLEQELSQGV